MHIDKSEILALKDYLYEILQKHADGISEYDLLKILKQENFSYFSDINHFDQANLFNRHFILFHTLYLLQQELHQMQAHHLSISPLVIQLEQYQHQNGQSLAEDDRLRHYYLDLSNLQSISARDIEYMLDRFWTRLLSGEKRASALATLGLQDPVNDDEIKHTYRKLVMQHHPDRGGDAEILQSINAAMKTLADA